MKPGEELGLRNEYFHILFNELLDELIIQVEYTEGESEYVESKKIEEVHGYWPVITGNIVTIQHEGGEY